MGWEDSIIGEQLASIQPSPSIPYIDQLSGSQQLFNKKPLMHGSQRVGVGTFLILHVSVFYL